MNMTANTAQVHSYEVHGFNVLCFYVYVLQWRRTGVSSERLKASNRLPRTVRTFFRFVSLDVLLCHFILFYFMYVVFSD